MRHLLQRHPFPVVAHFRDVLVVTYACPAKLLEPLVHPGLTLDVLADPHEPLGFLAVAMVDVDRLRPAGRGCCSSRRARRRRC